MAPPKQQILSSYVRHGMKELWVLLAVSWHLLCQILKMVSFFSENTSRSSLKLQRGYSWKHLAIQTESSCLGFFDTLLSTWGILFQGFRICDIQGRVALDGMGGCRHLDRDCMCIFTRDSIPFLGHYRTNSCTCHKQFAITDFCLCQ